MINIEILRLEINELLYHVEMFMGNNEKTEAKETLRTITLKYLFSETNVSKNDTDALNTLIQKLSFAMDTDDYNILVNNISTLIKFINIEA